MQSDNKIFLEVISTNPFDSAIIQSCGGNRIQLVSALQIGGVTPSSSIVRKSLQAASIPTHVIVRHHNNGFVHSKQEIDLLMNDIIQLKDRFKAHGIVVGGLQKHDDTLSIDRYLMEQVMKQCGKKIKVTFHKASDSTSNLYEAVKTLSQMNVDEILTQGGLQNALSISSIEAIKIIPQNLRSSKILAGGGISHANVKTIIKQWEIKRVHIGTCVRKNKYGAVDQHLLTQFRQILDHEL